MWSIAELSRIERNGGTREEAGRAKKKKTRKRESNRRGRGKREEEGRDAARSRWRKKHKKKKIRRFFPVFVSEFSFPFFFISVPFLPPLCICCLLFLLLLLSTILEEEEDEEESNSTSKIRSSFVAQKNELRTGFAIHRKIFSKKKRKTSEKFLLPFLLIAFRFTCSFIKKKNN